MYFNETLWNNYKSNSYLGMIPNHMKSLEIIGNLMKSFGIISKRHEILQIRLTSDCYEITGHYAKHMESRLLQTTAGYFWLGLPGRATAPSQFLGYSRLL